MKKKEISTKTATRGLINGFLAYGLLILFVFFCAVVFISWEVTSHADNIDTNVLNITLPIIGAFVVFFLIRLICRLSTFDLFHKCEIKKDDVPRVARNMNIFYICFIIFIVVLVFFALTVKFSNEKSDIEAQITEYETEFEDDPSYASYLSVDLIEEFANDRSITIFQTSIIEIGLLLGIITLVTFQKKLINRYNTYKVSAEEETAEIEASTDNTIDKSETKNTNEENSSDEQ